MANLQHVSFTLPDSAEAQKVARTRQMADLLAQQSQAPLQTSPGTPAPISPLQVLGKVLKGYGAMQKGKQADAEQVALADRVQDRRSADMSALVSALQGRPAQPAGLTEDASGNITQADALPAQTPVQSLGKAIPMMGDPSMQAAGLSAMQGAQTREDTQAARIQERMLAIDAATAQAAGNREFQERMARDRADLARELAELRATSNQDRSPYYQFLQTPTGYMAGNARTGQVQPVMHGGQQVVPAAIDPTTQRNLSGAKAGGKEAGEAQAQAQIDLPRVINNANNSLQLIDQMVGSEDQTVKPHAGFGSAVGVRFPGLGLIPGSDTANFNALLDQVKGGAFLEAFNSLKGGGQITEVEGKKATDAITRMSNAQSEAEFVKAAREYQNIIRLGVQRAEQKAGTAYTGPDRRKSNAVDFNSLKRR